MTKAQLRARAIADMPKRDAACYVLMAPPPSLNNAFYSRAEGGRGRSAAYRAWRNTAAREMQSRGIQHVSGFVEVQIEIGDSLFQGDLDNRIKGILDLLVDMMVIEDDRKVVEIRARRTRNDRVIIWATSVGWEHDA